MIDPLEALRAHQSGKCAICERERTLYVDHDHATGLVHGLLCVRCNTSEGASDYPWLRAYRANPPAAMLGLLVQYGQHQVKKPRMPSSSVGGWGWLEKLAVSASERPDWSPTLPDDPEEAAVITEFWKMFRAMGESIKVWREEDREEIAYRALNGASQT